MFVSNTLTIQTRVSAIVEGDAERRRRLETALAMLWAPLLHPAAARPVLARWLDRPGRRCASEARPVVGAKAALGQLPMRWRLVTLIAMGNLFGIDLHMPEPWPAAPTNCFVKQHRVGRLLRPKAVGSHLAAAWRSAHRPIT
jgi:hypothetical protein